MLSLLRSERKQKKILQIHLEFEHFSFVLTHRSFGIETILIRSYTPLRSSLKNHTRFQTKMDKVNTRFQTKTAQKPYPMGRTYLYS